MANIQIPQVGIGVIVVDLDNKILLGKRKNAHGAGEWSLPGGHLEFQESFEDCCVREVEEETGILICRHRIIPLTFTNNVFDKENLHYVTLFFMHELIENVTAHLREPDKCFGWGWFPEDDLPSPLFSPLKTLLDANHNFLTRFRRYK